MRVALAQINPVVGDLLGNADRILQAVDRVIGNEATPPALMVTPELSLWGYPPRDLLFSSAHLQQQTEALEVLCKGLASRGSAMALLVGFADAADDSLHPSLFNALALVEAGGWRVAARKQLLPSYDVFDETRYFRPSRERHTSHCARGEGTADWPHHLRRPLGGGRTARSPTGGTGSCGGPNRPTD